jgi:hypothetical protein
MMSPSVAGHPLHVLASAGMVIVACAAFGACTEGTTPDCSGNPSPCGYYQPLEGAATDASDTDGGGG